MCWQEQQILSDANILTESHLPDDLCTRKSHVKQISARLQPITEGRRPVHCWLHGKPGVGKTATARWALRKLDKEAGITGVYINCWEYPTFFSVLERIALELRMLGAEKLSTSFKLERLKKHISKERIVIVLDEIDQSPPKERNAILYNLGHLPTVGLICICNSQYVYFGLEERIKSRLNPARIFFEEYSFEELLTIITRRAQYGVIPGAYTKKLLRTVAGLADGDARIVIQTLKNAAYLAESDNHEKISSSHVKRAWNSAKDMKKSYVLQKLTDQHRLLYELIAKKDGILSGYLWRLYQKKCISMGTKPIAIRTYSN